jgi:chromosome segregation ATPase
MYTLEEALHVCKQELYACTYREKEAGNRLDVAEEAAKQCRREAEDAVEKLKHFESGSEGYQQALALCTLDLEKRKKELGECQSQLQTALGRLTEAESLKQNVHVPGADLGSCTADVGECKSQLNDEREIWDKQVNFGSACDCFRAWLLLLYNIQHTAGSARWLWTYL